MNKKKYQEWFDDECMKLKQEVNTKRKKYQEALRKELPQNETSIRKENFFKSLNNFNSMKRKKERLYWRQRKESLALTKMKNPKEFWKKLNVKRKGMPFNFSKDELFNYFKQLSGNQGEEKNNNVQNTNSNTEEELFCSFDSEILDILNRVISAEEIKQVIINLKNGKAAGLDKIIPELLKELDENFIDLIAQILNTIFESGNFPEEWALGIIVILFKEGTKSDLNNYRGITLLSMLGKLLVGILNNRLWKVVDKYEILKESQAGFRKGYRTTDHLFTLTAIIDHYVIKNKKTFISMFY